MNTNFLLNRHPEALRIALQGALFTGIMIILSSLTFTVDGNVTALTWLPMTAVFLWPRWSHPFVTPVLICLLGVLADLMMGRLLGLSSLVYLIFFWLVKPTERETKLGLWQAWLEFSFVTTLILHILIFLVGRVVDIDVDWHELWRQLFVVILAFPLVFALLALVRRWLIDPDDVNYQ